MFWSKLCKPNWKFAWNLAFPVFISPIVWNMCGNLPYESVYFKELHNEQECFWPTIYRAGAAVPSTITSHNHNIYTLPFLDGPSSYFDLIPLGLPLNCTLGSLPIMGNNLFLNRGLIHLQHTRIAVEFSPWNFFIAFKPKNRRMLRMNTPRVWRYKS